MNKLNAYQKLELCNSFVVNAILGKRTVDWHGRWLWTRTDIPYVPPPPPNPFAWYPKLIEVEGVKVVEVVVDTEEHGLLFAIPHTALR